MGKERFSREQTLRALQVADWDIGKAAKELNVWTTTIRNRIIVMKREGFKVMGTEDLTCRCFPTNEDRLDALDRPRGPGANRSTTRDEE